MAAVSAQSRHLLSGIDGAKSIASDAHKWLNVPYDSGFAFVASRQDLEESFSCQHAFIEDVQIDLTARSPENSRRARGLAIWTTLLAYGRSGYRQMIEHYLALATELAELIDSASDLELLAPVSLNVVLFRHRPQALGEEYLNDWNEAIGEHCANAGEVYIGSTTHFRDLIGFRSVIMNWSTTSEDLLAILAAVRRSAAELSCAELS